MSDTTNDFLLALGWLVMIACNLNFSFIVSVNFSVKFCFPCTAVRVPCWDNLLHGLKKSPSHDRPSADQHRGVPRSGPPPGGCKAPQNRKCNEISRERASSRHEWVTTCGWPGRQSRGDSRIRPFAMAGDSTGGMRCLQPYCPTHGA